MLIRNKKHFDANLFKQQIALIDWTELYNCLDVNSAYGMFEEKYLEKLNAMAPFKKSQVRNRVTPWVAESTTDLMKERNQARIKAAESNLPEDWTNFRLLRNRCTAKIIKDKNKYMKDRYETFQAENDVKGLYRHLKSHMGWKHAGPPSALRLEGNIVRKPAEIADILNKFYKKKIDDLTSKLPRNNIDPLTTLKAALERWGPRTTNLSSLILQPVGREHTLKLIKKLGSSTAFGHDGLDSITLKIVAAEVALPVNYIINLSISTSTFPNKWKVGRVIPLLKSKTKDQLSPGSYRPVSQLSVISKLAEKTVQEQLDRHMKSQHLWNHDHHAYKAHHSTTSALSQLTDQIFEAGDENKIAVTMSIDETTAFDCINHHVLIQKLNLYNLHTTACTWISSYLSHRSQYVAIGAHKSPFISTNQGVPQGSILGPTLFNV